MGDDSALLQSGEYEFCSRKKIKNVRLFMPMMMNCCSSKRRKSSSYIDHDDSFNAEDLIWEILFCLPPKHVIRFKCVSKRWYSIISNPEFLRNHSLRYHHHHHRPNFLQPPHSHNDDFLLLPQDGDQDVLLLNLLLDHDSPDQPLAHLSVLPITGVLPVAKGSEFRFVDSCNGLLLYADTHNNKQRIGFRCISRKISFIHDDDDDLYYLFNPVTKDYIKLPDLKLALLFEGDENKKFKYTNLDTRILFDPSVSLSYKVIRFVCRSIDRSVHGGYRGTESGGQCQFYIYSSESGSWRLSASVASGFQLASITGVFLNGVMYWVTTGNDLICFDAEKNGVLFQPLPLKLKPKFEYCYPFYFGKCGGRLCLIEKYFRKYVGRCNLTLHDGFDILEMTTEDARWTKKYHVNLVVNHHHLIAAEIRILHIYKTRNQFKEEEEEEALLMKIDGRIVSFSLKSNTFFGKELTIPNSSHPFGHADVYPISMSLFPL